MAEPLCQLSCSPLCLAWPQCWPVRLWWAGTVGSPPHFLGALLLPSYPFPAVPPNAPPPLIYAYLPIPPITGYMFLL